MASENSRKNLCLDSYKYDKIALFFFFFFFF